MTFSDVVAPKGAVLLPALCNVAPKRAVIFL